MGLLPFQDHERLLIGAHTHHISMTDGVLTLDWPARCPQFAPAVKERFAITGTAYLEE